MEIISSTSTPSTRRQLDGVISTPVAGCSRAQTQNWGSSLHTRSYDSPAWGPTEKVVRGPVSAGLSTRTPGVGLKSKAVAAVAVARRRSIMGGQHARSSVRGGRRAALSRGIGGRRPGPPLVVRGAPSTGFRGRWQPVFTSEARLPSGRASASFKNRRNSPGGLEVYIHISLPVEFRMGTFSPPFSIGGNRQSPIGREGGSGGRRGRRI